MTALAAALCYGAASVLQAVPAAQAAAEHGGAVGHRGIARLVTRPAYVAGLALDGAGFLASVVALRTLPLFLVQAAVASSVGVTAVLAVRLLGAHLSRRDVRLLVGLGAGLLLLAVSAQPERAVPLSFRGQLALALGAAALGAAALAASRRERPGHGAWAAAGAGLAFGGVGVCARVLQVPQPWWHVLWDPALWGLVAYGVLGTGLFAAALTRGAVTRVAAVTFAVETVVPAAFGLVLLGDSARPGLGWAALIGFVLTVGCAIGLAGHAAPGEEAT